jgi:hypothetical protein
VPDHLRELVSFAVPSVNVRGSFILVHSCMATVSEICQRCHSILHRISLSKCTSLLSMSKDLQSPQARSAASINHRLQSCATGLWGSLVKAISRINPPPRSGAAGQGTGSSSEAAFTPVGQSSTHDVTPQNVTPPPPSHLPLSFPPFV